MENNKLISMTEFVNRIDELVLKKNNDNNLSLEIRQFRVIKRYAAFLLQPLKLEMFVPVKNGNILEKPKEVPQVGTNERIVFDNYYKSKSKVLFEGFNYIKHGKHESENKVQYMDLDVYPAFFNDKTIEFLCEVSLMQESPIALSEKALKQIYG